MTGFRLSIVSLAILLPALVAWLDGRRLLRKREDPMFAERWWAYRGRLGLFSTAGMITPFYLMAPAFWPCVAASAATMCATLVAYHPLRSALCGETWSVWRYVATTVRRAVAFVGFWILLALAPHVILALPGVPSSGAVAMVLLLLAAIYYEDRLFVRLVAATPFGDLPPGFRHVLARARLSRPVAVYRAGVPGSRWPSAVAVSSVRGAAVVIADTLVDALDPDELTAVFAHEVAHLEHWNRRRAGRAAANQVILAIIAGVITVLATRLGYHFAVLVAHAWALGVGLGLTMCLIARRGHEADSDVRAVALCGDGEAMARTLIALHRLAGLPRRVSNVEEELSTHPSLARRVQAVRHAAGIRPRTGALPVVLTSSTPGRVVVLDGTGAEWLESVANDAPREPAAVRRAGRSVRSLPYGELTELRITTRLRPGVWLRATDRSGRSWSTKLRAAEIPAVTAALDVIDERLSRDVPSIPYLWVASAVIAGFAGIVAMRRGEIGPALALSTLVLVRPRRSPPWIVALFVLVLWVEDIVVPGHWTSLVPLPTALIASMRAAVLAAFVIYPVIVGRLALRPKRAEERAVAGALLALALVVGASSVWVATADAASIPQSRITAIGLAVLLAAVVVGLGRSRFRTFLAPATAVVAIVIVWFGSRALAAWVPLASGTPLALADAATAGTDVVSLDRAAGRLMLAPSAEHFAVSIAPSRPDEQPRVVVGRFGGEQRRGTAEDLSFLDDAHAIFVRRSRAGLAIGTFALDSWSESSWSVPLPAMYSPAVYGDGRTGRWSVTGWDDREDRAITATGRVGDPASRVKRWALPRYRDLEFFYLPRVDAAFAAARTRGADSHAPPLSFLAGVGPARWQLWKLDGDHAVPLATTPAILLCLEPLVNDEALTCLAQYRTHTVVWSVAGADGTISRVGAIAGGFRLARNGPGHVLLLLRDGVVLRVQRDGRQGDRFRPAIALEHPSGLDSTARHFAILDRRASGVRLTLHEAR